MGDGMVLRQILRARFERFRLTQEPVSLLLSKAEARAVTAALDAAMRAGDLEPALVAAWNAGRLPEAILRDFLGWSDGQIRKSESRALARLGRRPAGVDDAIAKGADNEEDRALAKGGRALAKHVAELRRVLGDFD
jgi:hypothetical protein